MRFLKALFHRGKTAYAMFPGNPGFNPVMVQRPLIEAGNTGRYYRDAFQVAFNSPVGGGTMPFGNAPGLPRNALAVNPQMIGMYGGMGSIPQTPAVGGGLVPGFRQNVL
jgi:hypothetical protein